MHGSIADEPQHAGPAAAADSPASGQLGVAHPPVTFKPGNQDSVHRVGAHRRVPRSGAVGVPDQRQSADDLDPRIPGRARNRSRSAASAASPVLWKVRDDGNWPNATLHAICNSSALLHLASLCRKKGVWAEWADAVLFKR